MKLLTRDTDYAVRALIYIAKKDRLVSVSELVTRLKIPHSFLRKIMQALNKKGILKSHKGIGGGFLLAKPPKDILLLDISGIFQGDFKLNECIFKKKLCPNRGGCALREKVGSIEDYVISRLSSVTIASLCK